MKKSLLASTITLCTLAVSTAFTVQAEPTGPQPQTNQQPPSPEEVQNQLPTPPPEPEGGKDLVTIGDSFTANGPTPNPRVHSYTTPPREPDISPNGCNQDQENWPRIAAQQKQWSLADYSCNGAQAKQVATYLKQATDNKDLGPNTKNSSSPSADFKKPSNSKQQSEHSTSPPPTPTYTPHTSPPLKPGCPPSHQTPNSSPPPTNHSPHPATTSAPPPPKPTNPSPYTSHSATKPKKHSTTT